MREYAKKPENQSRTLDSNPKASKQAPIDAILQRYKERSIQRYTEGEDEELIQGKFDTVQREEINENELLQGKFASDSQTEQEPIQREEKPNNTGLPNNLKIAIENLSGYSMDDIKVHYNSDKPAQLQALAYTQGTDIYVSSGQEKYLPHEAWHVIQQKQGRVQPTAQLQEVNINTNKGLEKEADIMGDKALNEKQNSVDIQQKITEKSLSDDDYLVQKQTNNSVPIQLWIKMSIEDESMSSGITLEHQVRILSTAFDKGKPRDDHFVLLTNFGDAAKKVLQSITFLGIKTSKEQDDIVLDKLKEWMGVIPFDGDVKDGDRKGDVLDAVTGKDQYDIREKAKVRAEMRYYNTYEELTWALLEAARVTHQVHIEDDIEMEIKVAKHILDNSSVKSDLKGLIEKVKDVYNETDEKFKKTPTYYALVSEGKTYKNLFEDMKSDLPVLEQIAILHDLKSVFSGAAQDREPSYELEISEQTKIQIEKTKMRYNVGTLDEADDWTLFMRAKGRNIWAGPSYTVYNMLDMAQKLEATDSEKKSMVYAIFAFWCVVYPHSATPIHTFHEVMTPAQKFGVTYDPQKTILQNAILNDFTIS